MKLQGRKRLGMWFRRMSVSHTVLLPISSLCDMHVLSSHLVELQWEWGVESKCIQASDSGPSHVGIERGGILRPMPKAHGSFLMPPCPAKLSHLAGTIHLQSTFRLAPIYACGRCWKRKRNLRKEGRAGRSSLHLEINDNPCSFVETKDKRR